MNTQKTTLALSLALAITSSSVFATSVPNVTFYNDRATFLALDMDIVNDENFSGQPTGSTGSQCPSFNYTFCNFIGYPLAIFEAAGQNWIGTDQTSRDMGVFFQPADQIAFVGFDIIFNTGGQAGAFVWEDDVSLRMNGSQQSTTVDPINGGGATPGFSTGFVGLAIADLSEDVYFELVTIFDGSQSATAGYSNFIFGARQASEPEPTLPVNDPPATPIPAPGSIALMMIGVLGMVASRKRK